jgi:hypothetical protein
MEELGVLPQLEVRASDSDIHQYFMSQRSGFPDLLKNNEGLWKRAAITTWYKYKMHHV